MKGKRFNRRRRWNPPAGEFIAIPTGNHLISARNKLWQLFGDWWHVIDG
jgi:hypothetical protein